MSSNLSFKKINPHLLNITAFFMGFCSICYELLIASKLSRVFGEGMFLYPLCIAIFILFMGLGGTFCYFNLKSKTTSPLRILLFTEIFLTFLGLISIFTINLLLFDSLYTINLEAKAFGLILAAVIGFLSGQELPLIFELINELRLNQKNIRQVIFADYIASLAASVLCALFFFARFGFLKTSIIISFVNFLLTFLILLILIINKFPTLRSTYFLQVGFLALFIFLGKYVDPLENILLNRVFMGDRNVKLLAKEHTPYQQVLLFTMRKDGGEILTSNEEILKNKDKYYLFATLNNSLQFFEPFEAIADPDHTFLFEPHIQFLPPLRNLLILGGGDGLPARQAVRYPQIESITMVDIDQKWVEFVLNNPFMQIKNQNALLDPRVKILYDDAFRWILKTKEKFDMIIIDFPAEPASLAKIRTTSLQFFRDLNKILNHQGIIVLHSNGWSNPLSLKLFAQTAQKAGLHLMVGQKEGSNQWTSIEQLLLFKDQDLRDHYLSQYTDEYLKLDKYFYNRIRFGTVRYYLAEPSEAWISFYDPMVSRLPAKKQLELMFHEKGHE